MEHQRPSHPARLPHGHHVHLWPSTVGHTSHVHCECDPKTVNVPRLCEHSTGNYVCDLSKRKRYGPHGVGHRSADFDFEAPPVPLNLHPKENFDSVHYDDAYQRSVCGVPDIYGVQVLTRARSIRRTESGELLFLFSSKKIKVHFSQSWTWMCYVFKYVYS